MENSWTGTDRRQFERHPLMLDAQVTIGGEHDFDQAFRVVGRFLAGDADAPARRHGDGTGIGLYGAGHHAKQRCLAGAVAADEAYPVARIDGGAGAVEQRTRADAIGDLIEPKHGEACITPTGAREPRKPTSRRKRLETKALRIFLPICDGGHFAALPYRLKWHSSIRGRGPIATK